MKTFNTAILLLLAAGATANGQVSFWNNSTVPAVQDTAADAASLTVGLRFYSDVAGSITGVRFFKGAQNTGQHVGILWSSAGANLGQATFSAETASGWQQATFPTPIAVSANTTYVISYLAPRGNYAVNENYAFTGLTSQNLHAGASAGVYSYGAAAAFPAANYQSSNYWVDPVFQATVAAPPPSPPAPTSLSFWNASKTPANADGNDGNSVTVGLKFTSDVAGSIKGLRFYKSANNTGSHVGTLWSNNGAKLAEAAFSGETASGWQLVTFASPVSVLANTVYVVSYLAPRGHYSSDEGYSWTALSAAPLHVSSSSPGVYAYGSASAFPQGTYNSTNYWVDPLFSPTSGGGGSTVTYNLSGTVTGSGATLTVSGAAAKSTTTNGAGAYTFTGLPNGSYVIAASQPGYKFTPSTAAATVSGASVGGINFSGSPAAHNVTVSWSPSTSGNVTGYNLYRSTVSGGPYQKLTASPIPVTGFVDTAVTAGATYFYAATTVDTSNKESGYSNISTATVPVP